MPFSTDTDTAKEQATPFNPAFLARVRETARHPLARRRPVDFDLRSPYRQMEAPKGAVWPRASIRPMPLLQGRRWWAAQIWDDQGVKALVRSEDGLPIPTGIWLSSNFATLPEAMDWAAAEVEKRRPKGEPPC